MHKENIGKYHRFVGAPVFAPNIMESKLNFKKVWQHYRNSTGIKKIGTYSALKV